DAQCTITTFDPPHSIFSYPESINKRGEVSGVYLDGRITAHGFIRDHRGILTTIDPPGSASSDARSINDAGEITAFFTDERGGPHGFIRDARGTITTFDVPSSYRIHVLDIIKLRGDTADYCYAST